MNAHDDLVKAVTDFLAAWHKGDIECIRDLYDHVEALEKSLAKANDGQTTTPNNH